MEKRAKERPWSSGKLTNAKKWHGPPKTKRENKREVEKIFGSILPLFWATFPVIFGTLGYFSSIFLALSSTFKRDFGIFLLLFCYLPWFLALFTLSATFETYFWDFFYYFSVIGSFYSFGYF